jgi:hypothetical protein
MCHTRVESLEKDKVICSQGGVRFDIEGIDAVVFALGYKANGQLAQAQSKKAHKIGDCAQPGNALAAIHEGFQLALEM